MAAVALPDLDQALEIANDAFRSRGVSYKNKSADPKQPVPIQIKMLDGTLRDIGIISLFESIEKDLPCTTDQVAKRIIDLVDRTICGSNGDEYYVSSNGWIVRSRTKAQPDGTFL